MTKAKVETAAREQAVAAVWDALNATVPGGIAHRRTAEMFLEALNPAAKAALRDYLNADEAATPDTAPVVTEGEPADAKMFEARRDALFASHGWTLAPAVEAADPLPEGACGVMGLCLLDKGHEGLHQTTVDRAADLDATHGYMVFEGPNGELMRTPYRAVPRSEPMSSEVCRGECDHYADPHYHRANNETALREAAERVIAIWHKPDPMTGFAGALRLLESALAVRDDAEGA